jgi:hypothetical protein
MIKATFLLFTLFFPASGFTARQGRISIGKEPSLLKMSPVDVFSELLLSKDDPNPYAFEVIRTLGQLVIPAAVGGIFVNSIEKQINANKENSEKQIIANKELICAYKDTTEKLISANKEICNESIKASEAKIESILMKFTSSKNDN